MLDPNGRPDVVDEDLEEDIIVPDSGDDTPADKTVDLDEEDTNDAEFKKLDNKAFAALRKEAAEAKKQRDELSRKVKDYESRQATPPVHRETQPKDLRNREIIGGVVVPETKEEWDALARKDWQTAVDLRSIISARKVRDEHVQVERATRTLDESKNKVIQRHPELEDVNSEKSKIFLKILDQNPEYLTMSKGPILAMRDMEEEMESLGYTRDQIFDNKKVLASNEAKRISRSSLTNSGKIVDSPSGRKVQLSKDDMEFCKSQGIDPVDYAKQKLELENNRKGASL